MILVALTKPVFSSAGILAPPLESRNKLSKRGRQENENKMATTIVSNNQKMEIVTIAII